MGLCCRYTSPLEKDNSLLSISINDELIQSVRLRPREGPGDASRSEYLTIPASRKEIYK
ncbi:MAG: cellulose biosynthesis cyclic di-GMP-binding regulatory protein BcsB [Gammaproteobacteria bacterium]